MFSFKNISSSNAAQSLFFIYVEIFNLNPSKFKKGDTVCFFDEESKIKGIVKGKTNIFPSRNINYNISNFCYLIEVAKDKFDISFEYEMSNSNFLLKEKII